jgi:hypothetical protein
MVPLPTPTDAATDAAGTVTLTTEGGRTEVDCVPVGPEDVSMHVIMTPTRTITIEE